MDFSHSMFLALGVLLVLGKEAFFSFITFYFIKVLHTRCRSARKRVRQSPQTFLTFVAF